MITLKFCFPRDFALFFGLLWGEIQEENGEGIKKEGKRKEEKVRKRNKRKVEENGKKSEMTAVGK